jgi:WD40 repeat protein
VASSIGTYLLTDENGWSISPASLGKESAFAAAFSANGDILTVANQGGTVRKWNLKTRTSTDLKTGASVVHSMSVSRDGQYIALSVDQGRVLLSAEGSVFTSLPEQDAVNCVAVSPDGSRLAVGREGGKITIWATHPNWLGDSSGVDLAPHLNRPLLTITGYQGPIFALAFSGDGNLLAAGGRDAENSIKIWDVATSVFDGQPDTLKIARDGSILAVLLPVKTRGTGIGSTGQRLKNIVLQDTASSQQTFLGQCPDCDDLSLSGDGHRIGIAQDGRLRVIFDSGGELTPFKNIAAGM